MQKGHIPGNPCMAESKKMKIETLALLQIQQQGEACDVSTHSEKERRRRGREERKKKKRMLWEEFESEKKKAMG
jgi:hypothetical protein